MRSQTKLWIHGTLLAAGGGLVSSSMVIGAPATASQTNAKTIQLEAEAGVLRGPTTATERAGYSGAGYATGFIKDGDKIVFTIADARPGIYEARLRYSSPNAEKGYELVVNGTRFSGMFPATTAAFATHDGGKVELKAGENTIVLEKGWGYYDLDAIELVPATVDMKLPKPPRTLADPQATTNARALLSYLVDQYGETTLSGQYDQQDNDYVQEITGKMPAIQGGDLMDYSPSRIERGTQPEGTVEKLIQAARSGQIITISWHWNAPNGLIDKKYTNNNGREIDAPWYRGFYTDATTFDLQKALDNPDSDEYKLLLRDIDAIAQQLQKFADADIPVLWRPLHEAEGGWFWWGAKGPEPLKQLWRLMFERLTTRHGLHNLIWVFNSAKTEWYPGDEFVDIQSIDAYPDLSDPLNSTWEDLRANHGSRKLLALAEFGGVPDIEKMRRFGVQWSFFVSWSGDLSARKMSHDALKRIYGSDVVVTRDEIDPAAVPYAVRQP